MAAGSMTSSRTQRFIYGLMDKYEPCVREHLAKVYMVLGSTIAVTAVGAILQLHNVIDLGLLSAIVLVLLVLGINFYKDNGKNYYQRFPMLLAFGFCSGQTLGPLLHHIISINATTIVTALTGTVIVFISLSLTALLAERGKYLYLGGLLISVITTMAILSLCNIFLQSYFVQWAQLYIGLFVMTGFVLFDTQNIVEKCRFGNRDVVQHALDLFFDILSIFRRLLLIMAQKQDRKRMEAKKF